MSKYSPEILKKISGALKVGHTREDACILVDINLDTFYQWLKDPEKPEFKAMVKRSERQLKNVLTRIVIRAAKKDPKMALEILQRKFSDEWAVTTKSKVSGYLSKDETEAEKKERLARVTRRMNELVEDKVSELKIKSEGEKNAQ